MYNSLINPNLMRVVSNIGKLYTLFGWHQFAICGYRGQCSRLMVDGDEIQPHSLKEVSYLERIIIMIFCCGSLHQGGIRAQKILSV